MRNVGLPKSRIRTVNFRLLKELLDEIPWETVFRDRGTEQSWQGFKDAFESASALCLPEKEIRQMRQETGVAEQGSTNQTEGGKNGEV